MGHPQAVKAAQPSQDELGDLFERIEGSFRRLEPYFGAPSAVGTIDTVLRIMVELLPILAVVTKEIKRARPSESIPALAIHLCFTILQKCFGRS